MLLWMLMVVGELTGSHYFSASGKEMDFWDRQMVGLSSLLYAGYGMFACLIRI